MQNPHNLAVQRAQQNALRHQDGVGYVLSQYRRPAHRAPDAASPGWMSGLISWLVPIGAIIGFFLGVAQGQLVLGLIFAVVGAMAGAIAVPLLYYGLRLAFSIVVGGGIIWILAVILQ